MTPQEYKDKLIAAQNQSTVAAELTKIWASTNPTYVGEEEILKKFIYFRVNIIKDFEKRYMQNGKQ